MRSTALGLLAVLTLVPRPAQALLEIRAPVRKTTDADFQVPVERLVLESGLTVLLSPDPTANTVQLDLCLNAGTIHEPPERSGLAHLVEHMMMKGPTPDTQYLTLLESRGGRDLNALTGPDAMVFRIAVPPEELPLGVWVHADRLGHLPGLLDRVDLAAHRRVVLQERAENTVDRPYGLVDQALFQSLFPRPNPLHDGVIGRPDELEQVTLADVRGFVDRLFVPANAVLVVAGNFEPETARRVVREAFRGLRPGERARPPKVASAVGRDVQVTATERLARQPRVTVAWRLVVPGRDSVERLELGALLLSISTSGAFGTRLQASTSRVGDEQVFRVDVTLPYDKPADSARGEAEAFLRYLTLTQTPIELVEAANLAYDRLELFALDGLAARAALLATLERGGLDPTAVEKLATAHWAYDPASVQETAHRYLSKSRVVLLAQPTRPRQARVERDLR